MLLFCAIPQKVCEKCHFWEDVSVRTLWKKGRLMLAVMRGKKRGCTSGGVYVPCTCMHARQELLKTTWVFVVVLVWCLLRAFLKNSFVCWFSHLAAWKYSIHHFNPWGQKCKCQGKCKWSLMTFVSWKTSIKGRRKVLWITIACSLLLPSSWQCVSWLCFLVSCSSQDQNYCVAYFPFKYGFKIVHYIQVSTHNTHF